MYLFNYQADALIIGQSGIVLQKDGKERSLSNKAKETNELNAILKEAIGLTVTDITQEIQYHPQGRPPITINLRGETNRLELEIKPVPASSQIPPEKSPIINQLFDSALSTGASDLHLTTNQKPILRIDGELKPLDDFDDINITLMEDLINTITPLRFKDVFRKNKDCDFAFSYENKCRFRINLFTDKTGPAAVMRIIPNKIKTPDELNIPESVKKLINSPKGLILFTGTKGSGKSTLVASLIEHINNSSSKHIITLEDPIEYIITSRKSIVNQREIGEHSISFKQALKSTLREDPDIIYISELNDPEHILAALELAENGCLVLATFMSASSYMTIERIIELFPEEKKDIIRIMIAENLLGVVTKILLKSTSNQKISAYEVLVINKAISNLLKEKKSYQIPSAMQAASENGMILLNDFLLDLIKKKEISNEEALAKSIDVKSLRSSLVKMGYLTQ